MGLMFSPSPDDEIAAGQMQSLFSSVLQCLRKADAAISAARASSATSTSDAGGVEGSSSGYAASDADITDLRMLIALMSTKY